MRILRHSALPLAGAVILLLTGCADQHASTDESHPKNWLAVHGEGSSASEAKGCRSCHGADLSGGTSGVACLQCHLEGPPFDRHAPDWPVPVLQHQTFALNYSWTGCSVGACHGADLMGGTRGPSCFWAFSCHEAGPPAPHARPYSSPESHGRAAKSNLVYCRNCHGTPSNHFTGGFVADPDILDITTACSLCHVEATAHPTFWQGTDDPNSAYLATHQDVIQWGANIEASCGLCHNTEGPGEGPREGAPSCFSATFVNAADTLLPCHSNGP